jgi:hypothetical protein
MEIHIGRLGGRALSPFGTQTGNEFAAPTALQLLTQALLPSVLAVGVASIPLMPVLLGPPGSTATA